ncbi:hypothetical protein PoMZ_02739, partial [Pyricularia oryzae]
MVQHSTVRYFCSARINQALITSAEISKSRPARHDKTPRHARTHITF